MKPLIKIFFFIVTFLLVQSTINAQVGINILQPDTSAILHLESTDRGFLPPRMTTQQRDNIFDPKAGLVIFNLEDSTLQYYTGRCWMPAWQQDCDECIFDFDIQNATGSIDRIVSNSDSTELYINQTNGTSSIALYVIANLPQGIEITFDSTVASGTDTVSLKVSADIFAPPGTYPIVVQAACDGSIKSQAYIVTVDPCIEIDLTAPQINYDLQAANNLPSNTPICVVLRVPPGLELTNDDSGAPVYTSGNLHTQTKVGIDNQGFMLARGGNGGIGAGFQGQTGEGDPGTDAMILTTHTHLQNTGRIYGGGGGGGSVGFLATIPIPPPIGNFNIGLGAGGGGGAQLGAGGNLGTGFGYYEAGSGATSGIFAIPGEGGELVTPISFTVTIAQFTITPNVIGGDGGNYGQQGQEGNMSFNLDVTISVPFIGNISIFNQTFPDPPLTVFPDGGAAGSAIKHQGNVLIGPADGNYQTTNIKGTVGN